MKYEGMTKQERKVKVKEDKKEKRKTKLPKSIKKAMTKRK
jgi:RIO kinase 1